MNRIYKSITPTGKPKIIDNNGFSIASSTDGSKENHELLERLVLSHNILALYSMDALRTMPLIAPDGFYKNK